MSVRILRMMKVLVAPAIVTAFLWQVGRNYMLREERDALKTQLAVSIAQLHEARTSHLQYEHRAQETEQRLREARRLAEQRAYQKLNQFLEAVQKESELQKGQDLYLVVSLSEGRLFLKRGVHTLKEYAISVGSGAVLAARGKKWIFETPRGVYPILDKKEHPVWIKPDWAFIENHEPIPPLNSPKRRVTGDLGKYGIYLGQGYLIHGMPPEKEPLIGLNISHGCIRMVENDLKEIYDTVQIGTVVIIR